MQLNNYLEYLEKTVMAYSDKVKRHLVKQFIQHGIATKQTDTSGQLYIEGLETVDISEKTLSEQLVTCIHQSKRAGYALEKWEFLKDYKYSVIFTCDDFSSTLKKAKEIIPLENTYENDYLYTSFVKPVAYSMDGYYFLKFNLAYAAIHPLTQEEFLTKYPFLVVFHEKGELIEFRFDVLNSVYTRSGQNSTPNSNATNLHSSQKRCCSFCISSSNASPTFQVQKSIFHQMTKPIQVTVILPLLLAISFSRNDDIHSSISGISNDLIGVIPTIGQ